MKASRSFGRLAAALLAMATMTSAWSDYLPQMEGLFVRQADTTTTSDSSSESASSSAANTYNLNTGAVSTDSASATDTDSSSSSTTGRATTTRTTSSSHASTATGNKTTYNSADGAGSIVMVTPSTTMAGTQLYRIGDYITWVWNYTSLQGTPTALDVLASCSYASRTYTLTQNMSFTSLGSYTWDTAGYQTAHPNVQLLTEQYTLIIYDADSSVSATAEAGYLTTYDDFTFGLYAGQNYTSLADGWTCAICSAGMSVAERQALGFAFVMSVVTVLSFTWFVTGLQL